MALTKTMKTNTIPAATGTQNGNTDDISILKLLRYNWHP